MNDSRIRATKGASSGLRIVLSFPKFGTRKKKLGTTTKSQVGSAWYVGGKMRFFQKERGKRKSLPG